MTLEAWTDFNVAVAGATAALAGLLIVALSVNVGEIVKAPTLTARAASAISTLLLGLVATASGLIPSQPLWVLGLELALATIVLARIVLKERMSWVQASGVALALLATATLAIAV